MFLPLFIAILLGLACPSNTNNHTHCNGGTTVVNTTEGDPGDNGNPGDPGDDSGDDTGGEGSQIPPIPPKNP